MRFDNEEASPGLKRGGVLNIVRHEVGVRCKPDAIPEKLELARSTEEEKQSQLQRLADFHARNAAQAPAMLQRLQQAVAARSGGPRADLAGRGRRVAAGESLSIASNDSAPV